MSSLLLAVGIGLLALLGAALSDFMRRGRTGGFSSPTSDTTKWEAGPGDRVSPSGELLRVDGGQASTRMDPRARLSGLRSQLLPVAKAYYDAVAGDTDVVTEQLRVSALSLNYVGEWLTRGARPADLESELQERTAVANRAIRSGKSARSRLAQSLEACDPAARQLWESLQRQGQQKEADWASSREWGQQADAEFEAAYRIRPQSSEFNQAMKQAAGIWSGEVDRSVSPSSSDLRAGGQHYLKLAEGLKKAASAHMVELKVAAHIITMLDE